jgi:HCOMODA/2-hydroxy-3-carboxy-muconic semialdehyde decarboxylase
MTRRVLICCFLILAAATLVSAQAPSIATKGPDPAQVAELVLANHILAEMGVLDGYGHVSVRDAHNPNRYLLARAIPAATVTAADIYVYDLDSKPIKGNASDSFWERFIHGEVYKARPDVMAVIHSHAPEVIPFTVTSVPLRPMIHMAGFLPQQVKVFDNRPLFGQTDLLIRSPEIGQALAAAMGSDPIILLRGHGVVLAGNSLHVAVGRAYYAALDARTEQQALLLTGGDKDKITFLAPEEAEKAATQDGFERTWTLWKSRQEKAIR